MNINNNQKILYPVNTTIKRKTMDRGKKVLAHNLRQIINNSLNEYIDPNFSHFNIYEGVLDHEEFVQEYNKMIKQANITRKIQVNASRIIEFCFSFSPKFSVGWKENKDLKEKIINYFNDCKNFILQKYGKVIISSAVHFYETTPHMHVMCIPLIYSKDGKECKFSSSTFLGGIKGLKNYHTEFFNIVGKKYGLARGIEGSRAKHIDLKKYKAQEEQKIIELNKKINEVTKKNEEIKKEKEYIEKEKITIEEEKKNNEKEKINIKNEKINIEKTKKETEEIKTNVCTMLVIT